MERGAQGCGRAAALAVVLQQRSARGGAGLELSLLEGSSAAAGSQAHVACWTRKQRLGLSRRFPPGLSHGCWNLRARLGGTFSTVANEVRRGGGPANGSCFH